LNRCSFTCQDEEETKRLGRAIAGSVEKGTLLILRGDLGCGKTVLTKGIASYFGIPEEEITSPSFTLIHEYETLIHGDFYRVGEEGLYDLGLEELLEDDRIKVFEWGEPVLEFEKNAVVIDCREEDGKRVFTVTDPEGKICEKIKRFLEGTCQE
jgi:tRNA threonylcarbamoyladenosine biosynthesis protein TsaE